MKDPVILCKTIISVFSATLHVGLLFIITHTPSLKCDGFDELFFSQSMGDVVAVILRVITKYCPALILSNHTRLVDFERDTFPLATVTNAGEWYTNYVIILSGLVFAVDRAVMVVSMRSYGWFCNRVFKMCLVVLTWLVPLVWVLPMLDTCCRSQYYGGRIELVEMKHPELKQNAPKKAPPGKAGETKLPMITDLLSVYTDGAALAHIPQIKDQGKDLQEEQLLHRLELELSFTIIAVIDQQIDFFSVLFYTLYWASYSNYIEMDGTRFLELYSYFFEVGNIMTPYVLLCFFSDLRVELLRCLKPSCFNSDDG